MRDDYQIPNMGQAPGAYNATFFNRVVRNIESTFFQMRANGKNTVTNIVYTPVTVDGLANIAKQPGNTAFTSNGRKVGQGAGAGTGVLVFYDGTNWIACDSGQPVSQ